MKNRRRPLVPGGDLELSLLTALWARQNATARELYADVGEPRDLVYTTIAKTLDRMWEKRMVQRRRAGRSYVYSPVAKQAETHRAMARNAIAKLARNDPEGAATALVGAIEDVSGALLEEISAVLTSRGRR